MITDIGMLDCSLYNPSYTVPIIDTHIKTPPPRNIFPDTALSEGKKILFEFLRRLHLNWYLSVVKTFAARNKFPHVKVARNTKKIGQACNRLC